MLKFIVGGGASVWSCFSTRFLLFISSLLRGASHIEELIRSQPSAYKQQYPPLPHKLNLKNIKGNQIIINLNYTLIKKINQSFFSIKYPNLKVYSLTMGCKANFIILVKIMCTCAYKKMIILKEIIA